MAAVAESENVWQRNIISVAKNRNGSLKSGRGENRNNIGKNDVKAKAKERKQRENRRKTLGHRQIMKAASLRRNNERKTVKKRKSVSETGENGESKYIM